MNGLDNFKTESKDLEQFTNVFKSDNIKMVSLYYWPKHSNPRWEGEIKYITGDLEGSKKFEQKEFKDLVQIMEHFINTYK